MDKIEISKDELRQILKEFCEDEYDSCPLNVNSLIDRVFDKFNSKNKCVKCGVKENLIQAWNPVHPTYPTDILCKMCYKEHYRDTFPG